MKIKYLVMFFFLSCSLSNSLGQEGIGIIGGLTLSNISISSRRFQGLTCDTKNLAGVQFGLSYRKKFKKTYLRTELLISQKGYKLDDIEDNSSYKGYQRLNYFNVPVLMEVKPGGSNSIISLIAGPYVSLALGGNYELKEVVGNSTNTFEGRIECANEVNSQNAGHFGNKSGIIKCFDFGLITGLGLNFNDFSINILYEHGGYNIEPDISFLSFDLVKYNRDIRISVIYYFKGKV